VARAGQGARNRPHRPPAGRGPGSPGTAGRATPLRASVKRTGRSRVPPVAPGRPHVSPRSPAARRRADLAPGGPGRLHPLRRWPRLGGRLQARSAGQVRGADPPYGQRRGAHPAAPRRGRPDRDRPDHHHHRGALDLRPGAPPLRGVRQAGGRQGEGDWARGLRVRPGGLAPGASGDPARPLRAARLPRRGDRLRPAGPLRGAGPARRDPGDQDRGRRRPGLAWRPPAPPPRWSAGPTTLVPAAWSA
jgi:hypothetical protein